jgi:hypothetical protein
LLKRFNSAPLWCPVCQHGVVLARFDLIDQRRRQGKTSPTPILISGGGHHGAMSTR